MPSRTPRKKLVFDSIVDVVAPAGRLRKAHTAPSAVGHRHQHSAVQRTERRAQVGAPGQVADDLVGDAAVSSRPSAGGERHHRHHVGGARRGGRGGGVIRHGCLLWPPRAPASMTCHVMAASSAVDGDGASRCVTACRHGSLGFPNRCPPPPPPPPSRRPGRAGSSSKPSPRSSTAARSRPRRRSASRSPSRPTCSPTATTAPPPRCATAAGRSGVAGDRRWSRSATTASAATFVPDQLGRWQYQVVGWLDHLGTWRHGMELKLAAGVDVTVDLQIGIGLDRPSPGPGEGRRRRGPARACATAWPPATPARSGSSPSEDEPHHGDGHIPDLDGRRAGARAASTSTRCSGAPASASPSPSWPAARRRGRPRAGPLQRVVRVLPPLDARPGDRPRHARRRHRPPRLRRRDGLRRRSTCRRSTRSATTQRKGRNNTTTPTSDDTGSPWAIGGAGRRAHRRAPRARHRRRRRQAGRRVPATGASSWPSTSPSSARPTTRGSPSTRTWFAHRPDGTIQYAENPPKKYQDIYPLDFESADWQGLWTGAGRRHPLLDRHRRDDLPRRQPAHQGVRLLGVGDRHDPRASTPRRSSSPRRSPARG